MAPPSAHRPRIFLAIVASAAVALAVAVTAAVAGVVASGAQLPDLQQKPPYDISARTAPRGRVVLTFASAVANVGKGPLILNGRRNRGTKTMTVTQEVLQADGTRQQVPVTGGMRYTPFGHNHWHFLRFDAFELHDPATGAQVAVGHKVGFCLGSRYTVESPPPGTPATPAINTNCGRFLPGLTRMRMGIDVGYADDYAAYLEFQYIDITSVPPGRYVVVHRAAPHGVLAGGDRPDDVASTLIDIAPVARRGQVPMVTTLASCPASDGGPAQPCTPAATS
jgi:hypothetical protein